MVIAIIGMLVGLLLPAINSAREAGRRAACSNNVKQVALALCNYVSTMGYLPPGAKLDPNAYNVTQNSSYDPWQEVGDTQTGKSGASWMLYILPFMEHKEIYDHWDFGHAVGYSVSPSQNAMYAQTDVREFYCPSRRSSMRPGDTDITYLNWATGGTDYGGCMGQANGWDNGVNSAPKQSHDFCACHYLSFVAGNPTTLGLAGVFYPNSNTLLSQVTDGASHTIMVGELQRLHNSSNLAGVNGTSQLSNDGWALAGVSTLFDCNQAGGGNDQGQPGGFNNNFFESAGSLHPGGANFAYVDGSVHYISENINSKAYAFLGSMADGFIAESIPNANLPD